MAARGSKVQQSKQKLKTKRAISKRKKTFEELVDDSIFNDGQKARIKLLTQKLLSSQKNKLNIPIPAPKGRSSKRIAVDFNKVRAQKYNNLIQNIEGAIRNASKRTTSVVRPTGRKRTAAQLSNVISNRFANLSNNKKRFLSSVIRSPGINTSKMTKSLNIIRPNRDEDTYISQMSKTLVNLPDTTNRLNSPKYSKITKSQEMDLLLVMFLDQYHDFKPKDSKTKTLYYDDFHVFLQNTIRPVIPPNITISNNWAPKQNRNGTLSGGSTLVRMLVEYGVIDSSLKIIAAGDGAMESKIKENILFNIDNVKTLCGSNNIKSATWTNIHNTRAPVQEICNQQQCTIKQHVRLALDAELSKSADIGNLHAPIYSNIPSFMDPGKYMAVTGFEHLKTSLFSQCCHGFMLVNISDLVFNIGSNLDKPLLSGRYSAVPGGGLVLTFNKIQTSLINVSQFSTGNSMVQEIAPAKYASNGIANRLGKYMGDCGQSLAILANPSKVNVFSSMDTIACLNHILLSAYVGKREPSILISGKLKSMMYYPESEQTAFNIFIGKSLQTENMKNRNRSRTGFGSSSPPKNNVLVKLAVRNNMRGQYPILNLNTAKNIIKKLRKTENSEIGKNLSTMAANNKYNRTTKNFIIKLKGISINYPYITKNNWFTAANKIKNSMVNNNAATNTNTSNAHQSKKQKRS